MFDFAEGIPTACTNSRFGPFASSEWRKANSRSLRGAPMSLRLCRYLKEDGLPCGSPAVRGQNLCYYHHRDQRNLLKFARDRRRAEVCDWKLPPLHTLADIQKALHRIANELWNGRLDLERAGPMLNATQQAAIPLRTTAKRR